MVRRCPSVFYESFQKPSTVPVTPVHRINFVGADKVRRTSSSDIFMHYRLNRYSVVTPAVAGLPENG